MFSSTLTVVQSSGPSHDYLVLRPPALSFAAWPCACCTLKHPFFFENERREAVRQKSHETKLKVTSDLRGGTHASPSAPWSHSHPHPPTDSQVQERSSEGPSSAAPPSLLCHASRMDGSDRALALANWHKIVSRPTNDLRPRQLRPLIWTEHVVQSARDKCAPSCAWPR